MQPLLGVRVVTTILILIFYCTESVSAGNPSVRAEGWPQAQQLQSIPSSSAAAAATAAAPDSPPPAVEFVHGYSNGACEAHPHAGQQLRDGGFLLVGDSQCYNGGSGNGTHCQHAAAPDAKRRVWVVKTDADGVLQWSTCLGDMGYNYGKFGTQLGDGTLVVVGASSVRDPTGLRHGYPYIERRTLWRLDDARGYTLSTTVLPATDASRGLRDGFMCATPAVRDNMTVWATGYVGGESGYDNKTHSYDDEPMFLIYGGSAFLAKISFAEINKDSKSKNAAVGTPPRQRRQQQQPQQHSPLSPIVSLFRVYDASRTPGFVAMQGMRVFEDVPNGVVALSAAAHTTTDTNVQFSLITADPATGHVRWARMFPARNVLQPLGTASHPYALTLASVPGAGYVIAGLALGGMKVEAEAGNPVGRVVHIAPNGTLLWDTRFRYNGKADFNTECYGVAVTKARAQDTVPGYTVVCGTGVEPESHPLAPAVDKTWRVFATHTAANTGKVLWQGLYSDNSKLQNNAGEFVTPTRDGGVAVMVDAQSWGSLETGGNFALMKLHPPSAPLSALSQSSEKQYNKKPIIMQDQQQQQQQPPVTLEQQPLKVRTNVEAWKGSGAYNQAGPSVKLFPRVAIKVANQARKTGGCNGQHGQQGLQWPPPSPLCNIVVRLTAGTASADACKAAALAYRNDSIPAVTGWSRVLFFTYYPGDPIDIKAKTTTSTTNATNATATAATTTTTTAATADAAAAADADAYAYAAAAAACFGVVDANSWDPVPTAAASGGPDAAIVSGIVAWPPQRCQRDEDCSLNGICVRREEEGKEGGGMCRCDPGWSGDRCQTMLLAPTQTAQLGLRATDNGANTSTWGGSVIRWPLPPLPPSRNSTATIPTTHPTGSRSTEWHMYAAEMVSHCGIDSWTTNSRIVHARATNPGGPYTRVGVAIPRFSHEPAVAVAPDGTLAMYYTAYATHNSSNQSTLLSSSRSSSPHHSSSSPLPPRSSPPPPACTACTNGTTAASCPTAVQGAAPTWLATASSPEGPWSTPRPVQLGPLGGIDTNLAGIILPNGTFVGMLRRSAGAEGSTIHLVTAQDWRNVGSGGYHVHPNALFPATSVTQYGLEDPSLWRDGRGNFHAVFHAQTERDDERICGAHAFSRDGVSWVYGGTSYGNTVEFLSGHTAVSAPMVAASKEKQGRRRRDRHRQHGQYAARLLEAQVDTPAAAALPSFNVTFTRRERPHVVMGHESDPYRVTHISTGVQFGNMGGGPGQDACFTLVQPLVQEEAQ